MISPLFDNFVLETTASTKRLVSVCVDEARVALQWCCAAKYLKHAKLTQIRNIQVLEIGGGNSWQGLTAFDQARLYYLGHVHFLYFATFGEKKHLVLKINSKSSHSIIVPVYSLPELFSRFRPPKIVSATAQDPKDWRRLQPSSLSVLS